MRHCNDNPKVQKTAQACDWLVTVRVAAVHYTIGWRKLEGCDAGCLVGMIGYVKGLSCRPAGST